MSAAAPAPAGRPVDGGLRTLAEAFERAARAAGGEIRLDASVAGQRLRVRLAGAALLPCVVPALAHLAVSSEASTPDLEVLAWDSASTGVALPPRELDAAPGAAGTVWQAGAGLLTALDATRRRGVLWTADAAAVPFNEAAAPLRVFLRLALAAAGTQLVHAAAVGRPDGGVLIVGRSGAGKSSTALACLGSRLGIAGDDYVALAGGAPPRVHSLYSSAKLNADQLARFPELAGGVVNREVPGDKPVLFLHPRWGGGIARSFPLRAALAPRVIGHGETTIARVGRASLLAAIAPSTIFQLPGTGAHTLRAIAAILAATPCYELRLGARLADIPPAIERALADAAG